MCLFRKYKILSSLLIAFSFLPGIRASIVDSGGSMANRPNIIIFLADDLGYGDLACYGNENISTPALDQLSSEGILFTDAYSSAPMCSPSRAGLLTGRNPGRAGGMYSRGRFTRSWVREIKTAELTDFELFNIHQDISQEKNLKDEYPEVFMRLKQELILFHHDVREDSPEL